MSTNIKRFSLDRKPEIPPTTPYDPGDPEQDPEPIPLPPDTHPQPAAPVREPDQPPPITDPSTPEPTRLTYAHHSCSRPPMSSTD